MEIKYVYMFGCLLVASFFFGFGTWSGSQYQKIEKEITKEMEAKPTKYKDEFSFGYSIGLIKCSKIVHEVLVD